MSHKKNQEKAELSIYQQALKVARAKGLFIIECGWPGVGRGLQVEVEILDDERTSTPAVFKDLDNVSPYLLLLCVAWPLWSVWSARRFGGLPSDERGSHLTGSGARHRVLWLPCWLPWVWA